MSGMDQGLLPFQIGSQRKVHAIAATLSYFLLSWRIETLRPDSASSGQSALDQVSISIKPSVRILISFHPVLRFIGWQLAAHPGRVFMAAVGQRAAVLATIHTRKENASPGMDIVTSLSNKGD